MTADLSPIPHTEDFLARAQELGVTLDAGDTNIFGTYLALLYEANATFNLTGVKDPADAWEKHILDSLSLLQCMPENQDASTKLIDIGSGGGAPGIVLAIALPNIQVTLIESTGKKARFLENCANRLGLKNIEIIPDRAETLAQDHKQFREKFDVVTARALGPMPVVAELCVPFAKIGGRVLLIKGQRAEEELKDAKAALTKLGAECAAVIPTPTGKVVVLTKRSRTPRDYPRRPGEPKRAPLK